MKRILLVLFLLSLSSNILATDKLAPDGWEFITKGSDDTTSIYVHPDKMMKNGDYVHVWRLHDYIKPNEWGNLSDVVWMLVDCKWYRFKSIGYSFHKKNMAQDLGKTIMPKNIEWEYIDAYTVSERIFYRVCD